MLRVLVVSDEPSGGSSLGELLAVHGFATLWARTSTEVLAALGIADMVLCAPRPVDLDVVELCRQVRRRSSVPLVVVAESDEVESVLVLEVGADDRLPASVPPRELVARIRGLARRAGLLHGSPRDLLVCGELIVDVPRRRVTVSGATVHLTAKEFDVLRLLAAADGAVVRREVVMQHVWDAHWHGESRTLDTHVCVLRSKLGPQVAIETVRGVGLRLAAPEPATRVVPSVLSR